MSIFIQSIQYLSRFCGIVAALLVGLAILVVCQMVVMRYFLNASTVWQTEFVTYSIVAATFIGSPYVLLIKGHVNVDLLPHYLAPFGRKILAIVAASLALVFCTVLAWQSYELFVEAYEGGWVTDTIWELPLWITYLPMFAGLFLLCLQYVSQILEFVPDLVSQEPASTLTLDRGVE